MVMKEKKKKYDMSSQEDAKIVRLHWYKKTWGKRSQKGRIQRRS